jgi:serine protease Do
MKSFKYKTILPALTLAFFAGLMMNHVSCSSSDEGILFGNSKQSPIHEEITATKAHEIQDVFRKVFALNSDRVVFITTEKVVRVQQNPFFQDPFMREFFGRQSRSRVQKRTGLGTGFIISEDGYICTNNHVVAGMDSVFVRVNDREYQAEIIGTDPNTDIALLKIKADKKLHPVYFGDSDKTTVGDWAIAIGNPFGLDRTFTVGVISAIKRDVDMVGSSHIQTDASINPGNSGGPLLNIYGEVIGINRMIYSKSGGYMGIGFAIPVNTARSILAQLKKFGRVKRGYFGVSIIPITGNNAAQLGLREPKGALIGDVLRGGPAAKGGIEVGDVILSVNGKEIKDYKDLIRIIGTTPVGKTLTLKVWRKRRNVILRVTVGERPRE